MSFTKEQKELIESLDRGDDEFIERMLVVERPKFAIGLERFTVEVESEVMKKIDRACESLGGISRAEFIVRVVREWVERNPDKVYLA